MTNDNKTGARPVKVGDVLLYNGSPVYVVSIADENTFSDRAGTMYCSSIRPDGVVDDTRGSHRLKPVRGGYGADYAYVLSDYGEDLKFLEVERTFTTVILPGKLDGYKFDGIYTEKPDSEDFEESHPAYGVVRIHSVSGSATLFDSELKHRHYVTLSVHRATRKRSLSSDWIHGSADAIVEVAMSEVQFARMVSSAGNGSGVPCTLQSVNGNMQEPLTHKSRMDKFGEEIDKHRSSADKAHRAAEAALEEILSGTKKMTKENLKNIKGLLEHSRMEMGTNMDFVVDQAHEAVEKIVDTGKAEIEAFIGHTATRLGMESLKSEMPRLASGTIDATPHDGKDVK